MVVAARLSWVHALPVANGVLGRLSGGASQEGYYRPGYGEPIRYPRYVPYPVTPQWRWEPMYWQLPSGEWLILY